MKSNTYLQTFFFLLFALRNILKHFSMYVICYLLLYPQILADQLTLHISTNLFLEVLAGKFVINYVHCTVYTIDLLSPPIRQPIPYGTLFRISHGFFSMYYLLSGSNGFFLSLTCISEEKSSFAAEDDILALLLRFC